MISSGARPYRYPWFRAIEDRDAFLFEYGGRVVRIGGAEAVPLLSTLLPHLDGRQTVAEIRRSLPGWDEARIAQALSVLLSNGIVALTGAPAPEEQEEHLLTALMGPPESGRAISLARVGVVGSGDLARAVSTLFEQSGLRDVRASSWDGSPDPCDLVIAAADGQDLPRLDAWNRLMLERGQPWLVVLPFDGVYGSVGPLIVPGETACYACLRLRRRSVLEDPQLAEVYDGRPAYHPMGAAVTSLMAGLAVHLGLRWIARRDAWSVGILYAVGLMPQPGVGAHEVFPVPRCPVCRASRHTPAPWPAAGRDGVERGS